MALLALSTPQWRLVQLIHLLELEKGSASPPAWRSFLLVKIPATATSSQIAPRELPESS
jgi:hypothetical protein